MDIPAIKYGPPTSFEPMYGVPNPPIQIMYGVPNPNPTLSAIVAILSLITSPIFIVCSFIVGSILYLITHKKIFIIIPLVLSFFCLIRYFFLNSVLGFQP